MTADQPTCEECGTSRNVTRVRTKWGAPERYLCGRHIPVLPFLTLYAIEGTISAAQWVRDVIWPKGLRRR